MRLRNKTLLILCFSGIFTSCNFLDFDESTGMTKDEAYSSFDNVRSLVANVYSYLPNDFGVIGKALRESATDNSNYVWNTSGVYKIYEDKWSPTTLVDDVWGNMYTAIQAANSYLNTYDEKYLERLQLNSDYKEQIEKFRVYAWEVRVLRAFYYFELAKRYGDVPLITEEVSLGDVNSLKRTPFKDVISFIETECSSAAPELPVSHKNFYLETGRVTRGTALALKSRALLYAASKLHNPDNDLSLWKKAADAAYSIIKEGWYSLPIIDNDPLYSKNGGNDVLNSAQLIFERRNGEDNTFEMNNLPIGYEGGNSGNTPTQNLVDAYEMSNGDKFDWTNSQHAANPYKDRDPRFYKTVVYNGAKLMNEEVETFEGGKNGLPLVGATETGYYLRKYINETVSLSPENPVKKQHHYILFRYAEILLNYAEAMHEWKGCTDPDFTDEEHLMSARQAVNEVRTAAKMPPITVAASEFTERLRNERRVELAFEDHRFWDIRRWKIGDVVKDIYGVHITKSGEYTPVKIQTRVWDDKMYLYPISQKERYINPNLGQNPGW